MPMGNDALDPRFGALNCHTGVSSGSRRPTASPRLTSSTPTRDDRAPGAMGWRPATAAWTGPLRWRGHSRSLGPETTAGCRDRCQGPGIRHGRDTCFSKGRRPPRLGRSAAPRGKDPRWPLVRARTATASVHLVRHRPGVSPRRLSAAHRSPVPSPEPSGPAPPLPRGTHERPRPRCSPLPLPAAARHGRERRPPSRRRRVRHA